jgi:hypothetical protein
MNKIIRKYEIFVINYIKKLKQYKTLDKLSFLENLSIENLE